MKKLRLSTLIRLAGLVLLVAGVASLRIINFHDLLGSRGSASPAPADVPDLQSRGLDKSAAGGLARSSKDRASTRESGGTETSGSDADEEDDGRPKAKVEWVKQDPEAEEEPKEVKVDIPARKDGPVAVYDADEPKVALPRPPSAKAEQINISATPDSTDAPVDIIEAQAEQSLANAGSGAAAAGAGGAGGAIAITAPQIPGIPEGEEPCKYPTLALGVKSGREMLLTRLPLLQATWLPTDVCGAVVIAGALGGSEAGFGKSALPEEELIIGEEDHGDKGEKDAVTANEYQQTVGILAVVDVITGIYSPPKSDAAAENKKGIIGPRFEILHKHRLEGLRDDKAAADAWKQQRTWGTNFTKKLSPKAAKAAANNNNVAAPKSVLASAEKKAPRLQRRAEKHSHGSEAPGSAPHHHNMVTPGKPFNAALEQEEDSRPEGGTNGGWERDADKNLPGFVELWNRFPDADWYFMVDDDTFLSLPTLANAVLKNPKYNPEQPYFIGAAYVFSGCSYTVDGKTHEEGVFAQGGGGMLLSRGGMKKLLGVVTKCMENFWECWAGDVRTAICMKTAGLDVTELSHEDVGAGGFWATWSEDVAKWPPGSPCDPLITIHHVTDPKQLHRLHRAASKLEPTEPFTFSAAYPALARVGDHKMLVAEEGRIRKGAWREGAEIKRIEVSPKFEGTLRNVTVSLANNGKVIAGSSFKGLTMTSGKFEGSDVERHALLCALACHQACEANDRCTAWTLDVATKSSDPETQRVCVLHGNLGRPRGQNGVADGAPEKPTFTEDEKKENSRVAKEQWNGLAVPWTGILYKGLRKWLDLGDTCAEVAKAKSLAAATAVTAQGTVN